MLSSLKFDQTCEIRFLCSKLGVLKKGMTKKIVFNLGFWLFLWLMFFLSFLKFETFAEAAKITALFVIPQIIPVYIHDYVFDYFVLKKRYFLYAVITLFIIFFFGYIIQEYQQSIHTDGQTETYGSLFFVMILYTGARYFRIGTLQKIKIKEEEERRKKAELELKEMEARQAHAELNLLKSQVNPHFLFNSLNSIYSLILSHSDTAGDSVIKLSELMRYLLESAQKRKVLVKHELHFLQNYIDLEKIRLGNKCKVNFDYGGDYDGKIISPMLLVPFIENCFKHGISTNSADNKIDLQIHIENNTLSLKTYNKLAPKRINPTEKNSQNGIENIKRRLLLLYPKRHTLIINMKDNEYKVDLNIEL